MFAAEAALKARRGAYELAGEPTPAEAKEIADMDSRLAEAAAATQASIGAVVAARDATPRWRLADGREAATFEEAERVRRRATSAEEDARGEYMRLHSRIDAACQARREATR
jgi:hypothetical protein